MFKTEQEAVQALQSTLSELEALTKSWKKDARLAKSDNDGDEDDMEKSVLGKAEGDEEGGLPPEAAPAPTGEPDGDEGAPAPEAPVGDEGGEMPVDEANGEGQEGDMMEQVAAEASQLSDEELDMMLHVLMQEKDGRMSQEDGAQAPAPEGDDGMEAPAPEPEEKSLAMSMKEEFAKMAKSFKDEVSSLKKSVDGLTAENAKLKKAAAKPAARPAASNKVEVLEKSVKAPERMTKSEATNYLLGQMRNKNKTVKADHVALVNAARSEDDLTYAYQVLKDEGVEIPAKK